MYVDSLNINSNIMTVEGVVELKIESRNPILDERTSEVSLDPRGV